VSRPARRLEVSSADKTTLDQLLGSGVQQVRVLLEALAVRHPGTRRIPNMATLRAEAKARNHRINRDRVIIQWNFSRRDAQAVFHDQANLFPRSEYER
jgi:hypothetical protein